MSDVQSTSICALEQFLERSGSDPFGAGLMPETVSEIVAFYAAGDDASVPA